MADKSNSQSRRSTTARAVVTHYAPLLEDFWTNPLAVVENFKAEGKIFEGKIFAV